MSDYTIFEAGPLSEWSQLNGVAPGKKFLEGELDLEFTGLSINATPPGGESPFWHTHAKVGEIYIFLEGTGELAVDDDIVPTKPGTMVRVGPDVWRAVRCLPDSDVPLKWLCIRNGGATLAAIGDDAEIDFGRPFPWSQEQ